MRALVLALLVGVASSQTLAQPAAVIEGVQMPAWRERDGTRLPLVPGMELRAGDRIVSGKDARIVVKLSEGSLVKLGENGRLVLSEMQPAKELFRAALQVLEGAFRFTTDLAAKTRKREVTVRVEQVTIGVRGTDFWGRSRAERQIVCLIEGAIQVGAAGEQAVTMNQPRQFYVRDKGKTQPVGLVEEKQLGQWALETDIQDGKGALAPRRALQRAARAGRQARRAGFDAKAAERCRLPGRDRAAQGSRQAHLHRAHPPTTFARRGAGARKSAERQVRRKRA